MRKLATVRVIDEINPIEGADAIEVATVGGWKVVVKKGEYDVGDKVIYIEIDSFVPTAIAPFLTKPGHHPKEYEEIEGERLRTVKLRGQISQGLIIPCQFETSFDGQLVKNDVSQSDEGADVTELLGIVKWDPPVPAQLAGQAKGNFPSQIPKTDQERIQNLKRDIVKYQEQGLTFEVTEKLDGSSMTVYILDGQFGVASRNLALKETEGNSFWKVAREYGIEGNLRSLGFDNYAIQGELIGEGIQGNKYGLKGQEFYVFDIYDVQKGEYLSGIDRVMVADALGLKHAPVLFTSFNIGQFENNIDQFLQFAEGKSVLNAKTEREGVVFKSHEDTSISFKAISNKFLLKGGD